MSKEKRMKLIIAPDPVEIELWLETSGSLVVLRGKNSDSASKGLICFLPSGEVMLEGNAELRGLSFDHNGCLVFKERHSS